jgi:hypothetical protein
MEDRLCAHDALRERRRRNEKCPTNLLCCQVTDFAQGERKLSFRRKKGMAPGEDEAEAIVFDFLAFVRCFVNAGFEAECQVSLRGVESRPLAHRVNGLETRSRYEPGAGVFRYASLRPGVQRGAKASCIASPARSRSPSKCTRVARILPDSDR